MVERQEHDLRLQLAAAREKARGGAPPEHHELVRKLEEEWKRVRERLDRLRHPAKD